LPISYPAILALAYQVSSHGGQAFSVFELLSSAGIFMGSILVSRFASIGSMRTVGVGLMLTGVFSLMILSPTLVSGLSPTLAILVLIVAALFVASVGNPIYAVANQTALIEAADPSNRGSVMATRFGLVQTASIVGIAVGGLVTKQYGPLAAYGVLGIGLILLAMYAIAAGRSTTNPLHGERYEEAMLGRAKS
jgi:predicted MFS family arabinose efflux permease